jgi:hypothetical protein
LIDEEEEKGDKKSKGGQAEHHNLISQHPLIKLASERIPHLI